MSIDILCSTKTRLIDPVTSQWFATGPAQTKRHRNTIDAYNITTMTHNIKTITHNITTMTHNIITILQHNITTMTHNITTMTHNIITIWQNKLSAKIRLTDRPQQVDVVYVSKGSPFEFLDPENKNHLINPHYYNRRRRCTFSVSSRVTFKTLAFEPIESLYSPVHPNITFKKISTSSTTIALQHLITNHTQ